MNDALDEALRTHRFLAVTGGNFSGRTATLRQLADLSTDDRRFDGPLGSGRAVYVPPEVYNAISGLASTVADELRLHDADPASSAFMWRLAEEASFDLLAERNPFELSGGEQAQLATISAIGLGRKLIALDCCLEQVDTAVRVRLLESLVGQNYPAIRIVLTDNRLAEYDEAPPSLHSPVTPRAALPASRAILGKLSPRALAPARPAHGELTLDKLAFAYHPGAPILRGISAQLTPGVVYLLEGRNGSGKSTLAKLLAGVLRPQAGRIFTGEREVQPWYQPARLVAYHFQNPDVQLFTRSVLEELSVSFPHEPSATLGLPQRATALAALFGLEHAIAEHPLDLPYVGRKRLALACTFAMGTPWLILDEPTLGQDDETMVSLARLVRAYAEAGGGVIIITHSQSFASMVGHRRILLRGGQLEQS